MTLFPRITRPVLGALLCATAIAFVPADAAAQRRGGGGGGRPGGAVAVPRMGGGPMVGGPMFYGGYRYYDPFFWGGWGPWGYPGWYGGGFMGPGMWGGGGMWGMNISSARLQVTPRSAEVYIDGYLAGVIDNFDGVFQRLNVAPGAHELTIYEEGYKPISQRILFRPGARFDLKEDMVPLAAGEPNAPRPTGAVRQVPGDFAAVPGTLVTPPDAQVFRIPPEAGAVEDSDFGTLAIRVQPADATLVVDGEEWSTSDGTVPTSIELTAGTHEIEVRKDGLRTFRRTVQVAPGQRVTLNVSLSR